MLSTRRVLWSVFTPAVLLAGSSFAQGADVCASAQPIAGTGVFAFNLTTATTDGLSNPLCLAFNQDQINNDVWFSWIPTTSSGFKISTCGQTSVDTRIAVYSGSCGGTIMVCGDDSCSTQTSVVVGATAGNVYIIRVGIYPGQTVGSGTFTITDALLDTQFNPANGHTYKLFDASSWTSAETVAIALGGHLATVNDLAENTWITSTWQMFQGTPHDLWIGFNDAAVEGTFVWADGTPVGYTNWDGGEPNNANAGEDYTNIRRDSATGNWNDLPDAPTGYFNAVYGVVEIGSTAFTSYCSGDGSDSACPCANPGTAGRGCDNTVNSGGASVAASGTASIAADSLVLTTDFAVPFGPGLYYEGNATANASAPFGIPFGNGLRCAGGATNRLEIRFADGTGKSSTTVSLAAFGAAVASTTYYYQTWYRDTGSVGACAPGAGFNLSNAISLAWVP